METATPTKREAVEAHIEQSRLHLVNLQSRAYELGRELKAIEQQIVPALASYQTAVNVLAQMKEEETSAQTPAKY